MNNTKANILCGIFGACAGVIPANIIMLTNSLSTNTLVLASAFCTAALVGTSVIGGMGMVGRIPMKGLPLAAGFIAVPVVTFGLTNGLI